MSISAIIYSLFLINLIVILAHESGFFLSLDEWVNKKWKFYHLPHIMMCGCCQAFWLSVLFIIITGNVTLFTLMLCFLNCHLTKITIPLGRMIENMILKVIEFVNRVLKL